MTVDEILDEIARRLHGNYRAVERKYAVEVTAHNFQEIVKTPRQSVLLLTYNKGMPRETVSHTQWPENTHTHKTHSHTHIHIH